MVPQLAVHSTDGTRLLFYDHYIIILSFLYLYSHILIFDTNYYLILINYYSYVVHMFYYSIVIQFCLYHSD